DEHVGDAADALWNHVEKWFKKGPEENSGRYYAKYSAIVQLSGMGKSDAVDEMNRFHFVIPVNLRGTSVVRYP
ncbi:hypothetical protein J3R83DRAFT_10303, partial [Lanmaoa asiatica]